MQQERARRRRRRSPPPHPPPPTLFKPWGAGLSGVVRGMCMLLIMPYLPHSSCTAKPRRACAARQGGQGPGSKPAARVQPPHGPAAAQRSRPKAQLQRSAAASKKLVQEACCAALQLGCRRGTCTAPYPPGSPGTPYPPRPPPTPHPPPKSTHPHILLDLLVLRIILQLLRRHSALQAAEGGPTPRASGLRPAPAPAHHVRTSNSSSSSSSAGGAAAARPGQGTPGVQGAGRRKGAP